MILSPGKEGLAFNPWKMDKLKGENKKHCHPEPVEGQMFFIFDYKKVFDKLRLTTARHLT
jgi:hypothetical protein